MALTPADIQESNRNTLDIFNRLSRDDALGFKLNKSILDSGLVVLTPIRPTKFIFGDDGERARNDDFTDFNQNVRGLQGLTLANARGNINAPAGSLRGRIKNETKGGSFFKRISGSVKKAAQETTKNTLRPSKLKENARQTKDIARPLVRELGKIAIASTALYYAAPLLASATSGAGAVTTATAGSTTTALASTNIGGGLVSSALAGEGLIVGAGTVLAPSAIGAGTVLAPTAAAVTVSSLSSTSAAAAAGLGALGTVIDKGKDIVAAEAVNRLGQVLVKNPNATGAVDFPGTRIVGNIDQPSIAPTLILMLAGIVGVFALIRS